MTKTLRLSKDLDLPIEAVTQAIGLVGQRGSGKTHCLAVLCEELIRAGAPVAILDPLGVLSGLRSSKDGKKPGLPVVILGGENGDVPLESTAGKAIAEWVVSERRPCVLDLSAFRKAEQRRFVTDFALTLYHRNKEPLHLIVDEADLFIPQRPRPDEAAMLGAFEDLIRRGRARGIGITIATQRPAVVHKDALTQVGALLAFRLVGPQDRDAIDAWIKYNGTTGEREKVLGSLGSLPVGTAWFWSPGWMGLLKKIGVRERQTFDSSSTPKLGAAKLKPKAMAPVDLDALRGKIADTIERAKAEDPKALKAEVARLTKELGKVRLDPDKVAAGEVSILKTQVAELTFALEDARRVLTERGQAAHAVAAELRATADRLVAMSDPRLAPPSKKRVAEFGRKFEDARQEPRQAPRQPTSNGAGLPKGERLILTAIAQHPDGVDREQLTALTGYKRSTRDAYLQRLTQGGHAAIDGSRITATPDGIAALGDFQPLPTRGELFLYWIDRLPAGEKAVLDAVSHRAIDREEITRITGYKRSTRDAYVQRLGVRKLITVRNGMVELSDHLK